MPDATIMRVARETTGPTALVDPSSYARLYDSSIRDPERFWAEHGRRLDWIKPYSRARDIARGLMEATHHVCPYSRATYANIAVETKLV